MMIQRGKLIVVESLGDNFGKTAIVNGILEQNPDWRHFSFPNRNTFAGKAIDSYLKDKDNLLSNKDPIAVASLFLTDMKLSLDEEIEPILSEGINVVLDRYYMSTILYETAMALIKEDSKGKLNSTTVLLFLDRLDILIFKILRLRVPDLTILLTDRHKVSKKEIKLENEFDKNTLLQNGVELVGEYLLGGTSDFNLGDLSTLDISDNGIERNTLERNMKNINEIIEGALK